MPLPSVWLEATPYKRRKKINSVKEESAENKLCKHQIKIYHVAGGQAPWRGYPRRKGEKMTITEINYIHCSPYVTRANLVKEMQVSIGTVDKRIHEIKEEIIRKRYSEFALIKDGGIMMVNYLVLIDYMHYRERLRDRNLRKTVPPYNPELVAREVGWYGN